jgi:hypothetical protein
MWTSGHARCKNTIRTKKPVTDNNLNLFSLCLTIYHISLNHIIRYLYRPIYEGHFIYCPDNV